MPRLTAFYFHFFKIAFSSLALGLSATASFAQEMAKDWLQQFPEAGHEGIHALMEATNGLLVAVGENKSDGYLLIADHSTGRIVKETRLGGSKDDALHAVAQTYNGHFLLAGASSSGGQGSSDAWLVEIDERGRIIRNAFFGGPGRDECRKMVWLPDGSVLMAGYKDGQKGGDIWFVKAGLQPKPETAATEKNTIATPGDQGLNWAVLWEKTLGNNEFEKLSGVAATPDGGIVFCGNTGKKAENGAGDIYLAKIDAKGNLLWKKTFGDKGWEEALDLIATQDGGFAIAGLTNSKGSGDLDAWLIKTGRDGFRQWDKTYGGKDADLANSVVQTDNGGFFLAGATKSQRSGARSFAAYVVKTSPGGDLLWDNPYGSDKEDVFTVACALHDQSVVVGGTTNKDAGWLLRLYDPYAKNAIASARDAATLQTSDAVLHSESGYLLPGNAHWVSFQMSNNGDIDLNDLRVSAENRSGNADLSYWTTNYCGKLRKGETAEVRIPVQAEANAAETVHQMHFEISTGTKALKSFDKNLEIRRPKSPTLSILQHSFNASANSDQIVLNLTLENSGDSTSRPAEVSFVYPKNITPQTAATIPLGVITAHGRREVRFGFVKTAQFNESVARFTCVIKSGGREHAHKTLEWQVGGKSNLLSNGPIMVWTDPAPHESADNRVRTNNDHLNVKMTVVSPKPVNTKNIKIKVNGVEMDGSKFNEEDLSEPRREETKYIYTYKNVVPLGQGQNKIQVLIDGEPSDELQVDFSPERANLHVVAIGPKHEDLQYTAKDAADFARAFENQAGPGKLFQEVFVKTLIAPEETGMSGIQQAMFDLAYQGKDGQIRPQDVLIVFFSSHGKIVENRFKLLQTGYNPKYDRLTLDYKTDILEVLSSLTCKKLIFLDACHSGGAKEGFGGVSKAVIELAKAQPGVGTLTSCGSTEKSYEDAAWQNGAFTEALLEAFGNKNCTDTSGQFKADADNDQILRLGELYDFLRRRVPALVQQVIPNAPTSQIPFMPEQQLERNLPLYLLPTN